MGPYLEGLKKTSGQDPSDERRQPIMKHRVRINVADRNGHRERILQSGIVRIPRRLRKFLFGDFCEVFVLTPGKSVAGIEINETQKDGEDEE